MQFIIHLALEKKTIGALKTSATCQIRKKQLTNDKCMTETMWFQLFSEINRISHGANMVGQNVPRSRTLCSELSLNIPGNRWSQSWKDTSVCLSQWCVAWKSPLWQAINDTGLLFWRSANSQLGLVQKRKASPYSITKRRVPELIPVHGSQPARDVSHKPGCWLPLLSARPTVTPATFKRAATNFAAWWTETR